MNDCSGRGLFNPNTSRCECGTTGWEAFGDFAFDFDDCDLYTPAVRGEWTTTIVFQLVSGSVAAYFFTLAGDWRESALKFMCLATMISSVALVTLGGLKISDPPARAIGHDVLTSVIYGIGSSATWTTISLGCYEIIRLCITLIAVGYPASLVAPQYALLKTLLVTLTICNVAFCFAPCITLDGRESLVYLAAALHGMGLGASMLIFGIWIVPFFVRPMLRMLSEIKKRDEDNGIAVVDGKWDREKRNRRKKIENATKRLRFMSNFALQQGCVQFSLAVPFALVPSVVRKNSYILPIAMMTGSVVSIVCIVILGLSLTTTDAKKRRGPRRKAGIEEAGGSSLYIGGTVIVASRVALNDPGNRLFARRRQTPRDAFLLRAHTLKVDDDTVMRRMLGKERARTWIRRLEGSVEGSVAQYVMRMTSMVVVPLVMMEVISPYVAVGTGIISCAYMTLAACTVINVRVFLALQRLPAVILRQFVVLVWIISLGDVLGWDARSSVIPTLYFFVPISLNFDSFIGVVKSDKNLEVRLLVWSTAIFPVVIFIILQFDYLPHRRDREIVFAILPGTLPTQWSTYQVCLNANFALILFMIRDGWSAFRSRGTNWLTFITKPVNVRIVGLNHANHRVGHGERRGGNDEEAQKAEEAQATAVRQPPAINAGNAKRFEDWSAMEITRMRLVNGFLSPAKIASRTGHEGELPQIQETVMSATAFVDVIVLRESDSLAVRWFGLEWGGRLLDFRGDARVSFLFFFMLAAPFIIWIMLVLPGVADPRFSYVTAISIVPEAFNATLRSQNLLRILLHRVDFIVDSLAATAYLVLFGRLLGFDLRAFPLPFLFILWLEYRTVDARCVYFHAGPRGRRLAQAEAKSRVLRGIRLLHVALALCLVVAVVALPVILTIGAVAGAGASDFLGEAVVLRPVSFPAGNVTNIDYETNAPPGWFANISLLQFVSDFMILLAINVSLEVLTDAFVRSSRWFGGKRKTRGDGNNVKRGGGRIRLKYFNAPVVPVFEHEEEREEEEEEEDAWSHRDVVEDSDPIRLMNLASEIEGDEEDGMGAREVAPQPIVIRSLIGSFGEVLGGERESKANVNDGSRDNDSKFKTTTGTTRTVVNGEQKVGLSAYDGG